MYKTARLNLSYRIQLCQKQNQQKQLLPSTQHGQISGS